MAATQGDVARRAGVSPRTVSNVVNEFPLVSANVRERVLRAIEELGYQPNLAARNLRRGRTGMIGLAVPELSVPYFSELAGFIIAEATQHSYTVVIEQTDGEPGRERELLRRNERGHLFDGLIFSPLGLGTAELQRNSGGIPVILLGEHIANGPYDHVGIDNVAAARDATAHLIALGRRRIGAIGHQSRSPGETGQLRSAGYREALRSAGLPFRKSLVIPAPSYHRSSGAAAMERLLGLQQPPDAVFCYNDLLAIGAMRTILSRGLRIPDDIAVIGFDDIEESRYSFPSLTTISPDKQEIARLAVAQLFRRLKGDTTTPASHRVGYRLVGRESTRAGMNSDQRPGSAIEPVGETTVRSGKKSESPERTVVLHRSCSLPPNDGRRTASRLVAASTPVSSARRSRSRMPAPRAFGGYPHWLPKHEQPGG